MDIVPLNSIKFDAETVPLNSIKFDDEVVSLSAIKFDDDIDTPKKPSAFDNFLSSVGSGMAEESKNQLNLKTSKIKEAAKTIPFATIRGLEAITSPVTSALEPFGIQTRKMLQESAEYYRPDLGSVPNYTIDIDKNFKPSIKKLKNAPVSEIVGGTAGGVGFILGPGALGMKAGELVTALPSIEKAARPFYRSILKGMIGGALTGEGKVDETLQNAAMFGVFEGLPYATKITKTIKDSTTWRRMTIKERGLVVQSLDDAIKANPKMTEGEILRKWNNPTWMEEATLKRATGEVPSGKIVPLNEIKFDTPTLVPESSLETSSSVPLADAQKTPGQVIMATELNAGDKFNIKGEEFKVKGVENGKVVIEDGEILRVAPDSDITVENLTKAPRAETPSAEPFQKVASELSDVRVDGEVPNEFGQWNITITEGKGVGKSFSVKTPEEISAKLAEVRATSIGKQASPVAPTSDIPAETGTGKAEESPVLLKAGKAWIDDQQRPVLGTIKPKGKRNKGKVIVILNKAGKRAKIDETAMIEWPEFEDLGREPIEEEQAVPRETKTETLPDGSTVDWNKIEKTEKDGLKATYYATYNKDGSFKKWSTRTDINRLKALEGTDGINLKQDNYGKQTGITKKETKGKQEGLGLVVEDPNQPEMFKKSGLGALAEEQKKTDQKGEVGIDINQKSETTYSFSPEIEKPYQSSKSIKPEGIIQRIRNLSIEVGHKFSRDFEHLINKKENAQLIFDLKRLEKQKDIVADRTARINGEVLSGLNKQEYDLFGRKIFLDDLYEDFRSGLYAGKEMPFDFKPESLKAEKAKLDSVIANNPKIQEAIAKRTEAWKMVQGEYIEALKPYKLGVEEMFKDNYYRHQVLDYVDTNGIFGAGKKLKSPTNKGYTKGRKGVSNLYNTDFFEAEHQIMAQMLHDIETAKTLTKVQVLEDISKEVRANAKEQKLKDWHKAIPEGYVTWQPREGQVFYPVMSFNEKIAEKIMSGELEGLEDIASELKKVLAVGGKRKEWVVRQEVADTLNNLVREKSPGVLSGIDLEVMRAWKRWQLISPRRYFKYQARNMTGDAEATFIGNPSAFMKTGQAIKELYDVFYSKKPMSEKMSAWFERGGVSSTLQAQEMDSLKKTWMFQRLYEKKMTPELWKKYWNAARISTDFRESILRFANFLDYAEQIETGKLKNYGASKPEMIDALTNKYDKAYWLSNDLLGAYDRVSVAGQVIRERAIPFWSWQEVNFKRYIQLFRNAANDDKLASAIGKKLGARGVVMSLKIGKLALKTTAFLALLQVWNHAFFDDEEKELPIDIKTKSHIIVGKDSSGNIHYFNRMGTLDDFISWFGLDYATKFVNQLIQGKLSWKELLKEQATKTYQAPINKVVQGAVPFTKLTAELISRKSTFPDVFKAGTVRDRWLHIARSIGLENEYIAMSSKPSRGYADSIKGLFLYKVSPGEAAYRNLFDMKDAFMKKTGRSSEGFWLTPTGDALYNMKLSLKYDDKEAFSKYLTEYVFLSGQQGKDNAQIKQGIKASIQRMHPLSNMNEKIKIEFINSLNKDDQDTLLKAVGFYNEVLSGGN